MKVINKDTILKRLKKDLEEWNETLSIMDEESMEHDYQIGEIQYIEYFIEVIEGKIP